MRYQQAHDGDWIEPVRRKGFRIRCCDCGLVHVVNFRVRRGKLQFQVFRDSKATAAARRKKGKT